MADLGGTDLRSTLYSAFSFVRSIESNRSSAAFTLDHAIAEQIAYLKKGATRDVVDGRGETLGNRPSRYDQLDRLQQMLDLAIEAVQDAGDDPERLTAIGIYEANLDEVTP